MHYSGKRRGRKEKQREDKERGGWECKIKTMPSKSEGNKGKEKGR